MTGIGFAITSGWALDRLLGEPPAAWHPVARFGSLMETVEQRTYRPTRSAGMVHLGIGVGIGVGTGLVTRRLLGRHLSVALTTAVSVAGRMLAAEAGAVLTLLERDDLDGARRRLRSLVGRDTTDLGEAEIARAVIESLAENTVDAMVAPLWWAAVAGAPGVLAHRAVNTLDAMVGHRTHRYEQFGWAAARLDDAMNYLPARIATLAVGLLMPHRAAAILRTVSRDAPAHPSPNGGIIEAATAAALQIRLGGENRYEGRSEARGVLGDGPEPTPGDARRAITLTAAVGGLVASAIAVLR